MLRSLDEMQGYTILASNGEIGHVEDFYFDDLAWTIRYLVVDTGPWLFGRRVLISPQAMGEPDWSAQVLPVALSKDQVENGPEIDLDRPVSRQQQVNLHTYYDWDLYWTRMQTPTTYGGAAAVPPPISEAGAQAETEQEEEDPHLRSVDEVIDYNIQTVDGSVGHVTDFLVQDGPWIIRYMVVNTRDWLPGRDVLVAPAWVRRINWPEASVHVDLAKDAIKNSPEYDPSSPIDRQYEARLYEHYDRPVYW